MIFVYSSTIERYIIVVNTDKEEYLKLLRKIGNDPEISQRDLSSELDMSLGKINYCLKALKSKGLIKIKNFLI